MNQSIELRLLRETGENLRARCTFYLPWNRGAGDYETPVVYCQKGSCELCRDKEKMVRLLFPEGKLSHLLEKRPKDLCQQANQIDPDTVCMVEELNYQGIHLGYLGVFNAPQDPGEKQLRVELEKILPHIAAWYFYSENERMHQEQGNGTRILPSRANEDYLLRNLLQQTNFGIVLVDIGGRFKEANLAFLSMLETDMAHLKGRSFLEITHPGDRDENSSYFQMLTENQTSYYILYKRFLSTSGKVIHARVSATLLNDEHGDSYVLGFVEDFSQSEAFRRSLRKQESKYFTLINNSQDAIFVHPVYVDGTVGNFVEVNDTACRRYGFSRAELFSKSPRDMESRKEKTRLPERIQEFLEKGHMLAETEHVDSSGREFPVEINAHLFELDGERVSMTIVRDITRRKENEQRNLEQERFLIHQSRMAAMGEMVSAIAHQWRQPLNILGLYIQDLLEEFREGQLDTDYMENTVQKFMDQIHYMSRTIDDFRDFVKPTGSQPVNFELIATIQNAVNLVEPQLKHSAIEIDFQSGVEEGTRIVCLGYPGELKQVMLTLLSNAKDAILAKRSGDRNGESEGKGRRTKGNVTLAIEMDEDNCMIHVLDSGTGIEQDVMEKLFDPYFTTRGENGTGVGLYVASRIISERMGGDLYASNREDGITGAVFHIKLPDCQLRAGKSR